MWTRVTTIGAVVILLNGFAQVTAAQRTEPKGNVENGRKTYLKIGCYQCHGREAQGGGAGSRLGPQPWAWEQFSKYVRAPRAEMPPYAAKILSDADLADIYAYVKSVPKASSPATIAPGGAKQTADGRR